MRMAIFLLVSTGLAACSTTAPLGEEEPLRRGPIGQCDASGIQNHIGHTATAEAGARLLELSGAETLRWVPPRSAVTMDYRPDRLTVSYNDAMVVTAIKCG